MGNSYSLDLEASSSQFGTMSDSSGLKPTGNWTVEAWIKLESTGAVHTIFQSYSQNTNIAGLRFGVNTSNQVFILSGKNTGTVQGTDYQEHNSTSTLLAGVWYHVAGVYDGSKLRVYINAKEEGTGTTWANNAAYAGTNYVKLGARSNAGTESAFFDGKIDEFRFWTTARSASQIESSFHKEINSGETFLEAYCQLNNSVNDSTANAHNLTLSGSPVFSTDIAFSETQSYSLDLESGSSQYASTTSDLGIAGGSCTFEAWIRPESLPSSGNLMTIMLQLDAGSHVFFELRLKNNGGTQQIQYMRNAEPVIEEGVTENFTLTTGQWYHLAMTYDGSTIRAYRDGVFINSASATTLGVSGLSDGFYVGSNQGSSRFFDGMIDEVRVWNTQRTGAEVLNNMSSIIDVDSTSLILYCRLENNYADLTDNNYWLIPSASPVFSSEVPSFPVTTDASIIVPIQSTSISRGYKVVGY